MKENNANMKNANDEVSFLSKNFNRFNILFLVFLVMFGIYAAVSINRETTISSKIVELCQKNNVEVEAKTNVLFGVWTKVRLVK